MEYYAVQVWTGKEIDYQNNIQRNNENKEIEIFIPKKVMNIRKAKKVTREEKVIFPGYVFFICNEEKISSEDIWTIRKTKYFIKMLPSTKEPQAIRENDLEIIKHFITRGKIADISKVTFDENDKICVIEGAMKGLEGQIIKVNKRKGRAKVKLCLFQNSYEIDFSFEDISKAN